ncbi:MAG: acyl transferase, partial [Ferruginibacter sp.]
MNTSVKNSMLSEKIFNANDETFNALAIEVFHFQYEYNKVYRQYCDTLQIAPHLITKLQQIPFLPIGFFKTHQVTTTEFEAAIIFESSGTSKTYNSRHYVKEISLYEKSFNLAFRLFYGDPVDWCILALLPSYLERNNSSLVMMAENLVLQSYHKQSGFYLSEWEKLHTTLMQLEKEGQKTLLLGVTFALLDFTEQYPVRLKYTTVMETGGMKGRREEMIREEVHAELCKHFKLQLVHSEYSMTELLSQAY